MTREVLRLSPNSTLEILASTPEVLEVEATYEAGGGPPPSHLHPDQDEHFKVLEGALRLVAGGVEQVLDAGQEIDIPRETPHQMWNAGDAPATARWETRPRGRTEDFFHAVDAVMPEGGGMPDLEPMLQLLRDYDDTFRLITE